MVKQKRQLSRRNFLRALTATTALASFASLTPLTERTAKAEEITIINPRTYCQEEFQEARKDIGDQEIQRMVNEAYKYVRTNNAKYLGDYVPRMFNYIKLNPKLFQEHGIREIGRTNVLIKLHEELSRRLQRGLLYEPPVFIDTDSYPAAMKIDLTNPREPKFVLNDTAKFLSFLVFELNQRGDGCTTVDYLAVDSDTQKLVPGFKLFTTAWLTPGYSVGIAPPSMVKRYVKTARIGNDSLLKGSDFSFEDIEPGFYITRGVGVSHFLVRVWEDRTIEFYYAISDEINLFKYYFKTLKDHEGNDILALLTIGNKPKPWSHLYAADMMLIWGNTRYRARYWLSGKKDGKPFKVDLDYDNLEVAAIYDPEGGGEVDFIMHDEKTSVAFAMGKDDVGFVAGKYSPLKSESELYELASLK